VLDRLVDMRLAGQKAAADRLGADPTVAEKLRIGQENMMADYYLEHEAKTHINDTVLKAKYDELAKQATPVQEVHARHILVKTEAEAKDIIAQLKKGADFEKLAKDKSTDPGSGASGGDLGYFTKDKMVPEFADAAFKLDVGKVSDAPVHSQFGWHVIQVLDKRNQPLPEFEKVKPQLENIVLQDEERKVMDDLHKTAKIEKFNPDGTPMVAAPPAPPPGAAPAPAATPAPAPAAAPAAAAPAPSGAPK
jgi:peptidyl-prolyl cis-trans isomerase C